MSDLVKGERDQFAAWSVEERADNQLLMCDFMNQTRSWFMVAPASDADQVTTRLFFGTAVVPLPSSTNKTPSIGFMFQATLGFHKFYSVALLAAAKARLKRFDTGDR